MKKVFSTYIFYILWKTREMKIFSTVETHKSLHHKSLRNFKSLRFFADFC